MKQKVKKISKTMTALIIACSVLFISLIGLTMAYFTDSKSFSGTLEFGEVKLKVTDKTGAEMSQTISFDFSRTGATKLMPGDTVTMNFNVSLQAGSEPAYYLVCVTDTNGVFDNATYYSDGSNIVKNSDTNHSVGEITASTTHNFSLSKEISLDYETQGGSTDVTLNIYAIQQANLSKYDSTNTDKSAYHLLSKKATGVEFAGYNSSTSKNSWKEAITNYANYTSIGFYKSTNVPVGYSEDTSLSSALDNKLINDSKGNIKVYTKSDTEIAFVSDYKIVAPANSLGLLSDATSVSTNSATNSNAISTLNKSLRAAPGGGPTAGGTETPESKITSICLDNLDTSKVTSMYAMFYGMSSLKELNLKNFNTSNVTDMASMFDGCSSLTSLDLSSFNTSKVTNMMRMFANCEKLATVDLHTFDTSNVTNMWSMFNTTKFTTLDLSSFDTKNVETMNYMFAGTFASSSGTLIISDKFVVNGEKATKANLYEATYFNQNITVKRGNETLTA